jgi:hypothetical protein
MRRGWDASAPGVLTLPSGRLIRGRGLRAPQPAGLDPQFAVYLLYRPPDLSAWPSRWVKWRDFGLPTDHVDARDALTQAWARARQERVEIACRGGRGRTGTALACTATLDGLSARAAVAFVREHYDPRAIETPWQRSYISRFASQ